MAAMSPNKLTADMLADLEVPHEVSLSPSTEHVVYTLRSDWNRPRGRWVSSLWIAEVGKQHSARQVTSGDSNDMWPQFSPDGNSIAFLSDRASEGIMSIWQTDLQGGDAVPLTSTDCKQGVAKFGWSANGEFIAYLSVDEKTAEKIEKEKKKDDAMVYGGDWEFASLRIVEVATRKMITLVSEDRHVYDFAWSPDSTSLAYTTQATPEATSANINGTSIGMIRVLDHHVSELSHFPGPLEDLCWSGDYLWWRAMFEPSSLLSSKSVYRMSIAAKTWNHYAFGKSDCASTWAMPPGLRKLSDIQLIAQVQDGLTDRLVMLPEEKIMYNEVHEIKSWDALSKNDKTVIVIVKSGASTPPEVYSIIGSNTCCLSRHGEELAELEIATSEPFYATAQDGTELDGILVHPKNHDLPLPWPTITLVHGGPYQRVSNGFDLPYFNWSPWFASAGYAVLCVNYRGGSAHGSAWAGALKQAAGTVDYSDVVDLVKSGIDRGIIDKDRIGLAGWSYGGYLAYLAVTRDSTFHFQAVMCGAGFVDWDMAIMTQEDSLWAARIAGHAPWEVDNNNTKNRENSAIWHMQDIRTPILILHGEEDAVVPVSQARAFHQGCLHRNIQCELVIYPREGHGMFPPFERAHYLDMLERMKRFFDKHLLRNVT